MCLGLLTQDIGVDLGTANTLIYKKPKGIILNEPSVIAIDERTSKVIAVGNEAKEMIGRSPWHIRVVRPLQDGVISDFMMTQEMLKQFMMKALQGKNLFTKTRIVVGVPSGVTGVEKRAVEEVLRQMGAREVYVLNEPMASAIGVGIPVDKSEGYMVADIGGGTSDIAIIALGGIVNSISLRVAGDEMDDAIMAYMRRNYNLLIGEQTAEELKIGIGCAVPPEDGERPMMEAKGRDVMTGLPKSVMVSTSDMMKALEEVVSAIEEGIRNTLENSPPELAADIVRNGITLAGGGAMLNGLDKLIEHHTGIKVNIAENALEAVVEGAGKSLEHVNKLKGYTMTSIDYGSGQ